ncbi:MAG: exo-beta-N-acetylmuramidase NamZ domain-containing protein [Sumerlaeia bacterium]
MNPKKNANYTLQLCSLFIILTLLISSCASSNVRQSQIMLSEPGTPMVRTGLDVLQEQGFASLQGKRVGLITNHSGINVQGRQNIDLMVEAGVNLVALYSPEHGIRGETDTLVDSSVDEKTGLTIHSLYGKTRRPKPEILEGVDVLVFDIQDIGARFYTYIGTMGYCMEESAKLGIEFVVLDRPNPIRGDWFDGPIQDVDLVGSFTAYRALPTVHGMTIGEMAVYFNEYAGGSEFDNGIGCKLTVVKVKGWNRSLFFDETGLPWVNPSPNMRSLNEELIYTMVAQTEANKIISMGRGTDRPFEYLGAPWVDGALLTAAFRERNLPGLWFMQTTFVPSAVDISGRKNYPYQFIDEICHGIRIVVTDRNTVSPVEAGVHMIDILLRLYPEKYDTKQLRGLVGAQWVLDAVNQGTAPAAIAAEWRTREEFKQFQKARKSVLMY